MKYDCLQRQQMALLKMYFEIFFHILKFVSMLSSLEKSFFFLFQNKRIFITPVKFELNSKLINIKQSKFFLEVLILKGV